jgi:Integrase zinc binding domain/Integrase core domain
MNRDLYYALVKLLTTGIMPTNVSKETEKLARRVSPYYQTVKTDLYRIEPGKSTTDNPPGGRQHLGPRKVIPEHLKKSTLSTVHNTDHLGQNNTYHQLSRTFYWPGMKMDCYEFVRTCPTCQKRQKRSGHAPLQPIKKVPNPFYQVGIDVMGPMPTTSTGNRYIVLAIDHFTKWIEARALETADAQNIAVFIHDEILSRHGTPSIITTDRGSEFDNELIKIMTKKYQIRHITTTAYHPEGNGQTERSNDTVKNILAAITPKNGSWDQYLSIALAATRYTKSKSTNFSPHELLHGFPYRRNYEPEGLIDDDLTPIEWAQKEFSRIRSIQKLGSQFIKRAQDRQKRQHDKESRLLQPLKIGDAVMLYRSIIDTSWSRKMERKFDGPYYVQNVKGLTYRLRRPDGTIIPNTFHRNKLEIYHERNPARTSYPRRQGPYVEIPVRKKTTTLQIQSLLIDSEDYHRQDLSSTQTLEASELWDNTRNNTTW